VVFLITSITWIVFHVGCAERQESAQSQEPEEKSKSELELLVDQVLVAYGGVPNLSRIRSYRSEGVITAVHDRAVGETVRWFRRPDLMRVELRYPTRGEIRVTRGNQAWVGRDDLSLTSPGEPFLSALRLQAVRLDLPIQLREGEASLVLMADDENERPVVRSLLDEGLTLDYHVDPETFRVERVTMRIAVTTEVLSFDVDYSEFRWVRGVLFPFQEEIWTNGEKSAEVRIRNIDLNPLIPLEVFGPRGP
jgi:outer membrane lipoprotein-sorting protein